MAQELQKDHYSMLDRRYDQKWGHKASCIRLVYTTVRKYVQLDMMDVQMTFLVVRRSLMDNHRIHNNANLQKQLCTLSLRIDLVLLSPMMIAIPIIFWKKRRVKNNMAVNKSMSCTKVLALENNAYL